MAKDLTIIGIYGKIEEVVEAVKRLKSEKIRIGSVFSPFRSPEIREALGDPPLGVGRFITLAGAITGIATGIFLAAYTAAQWRFVVGGKYPIPYVPTVIPAFEFLILIAVFFSLFGMLWMNRMPRRKLSKNYDPRFSQDLFGILVHCDERDFENVSNLLSRLGAREVRRIE